MRLLKSFPFSTIVILLVIGYSAITLFFLTFLIPPFQKADEYGHYWRAIAVSKGTLFCDTSNQGLIEKKYLDFKNYFQVENHVFKETSLFPISLITHYNKIFNSNSTGKFNAGLCQNSPFGYFFNIVGFYLGNFLFENNLLIQFYLMRIVPALVYFVLVLCLQRRIKNYNVRLFYLIFSFLPMILHQVSAISLDSSIFIFFNPLVYLILSDVTSAQIQKRITYGNLVFFFAGLISLIKPIYIPLLFLGFLFKFSKKSLLFILITLILIGYQVKTYENYPLSPNLFSLKAQKQIIFSDPIFFFRAINNFLNSKRLVIPRFMEIFGVFGWADSSINFFLVLSLFFILTSLLWKTEIFLNKRSQIIFSLAILGTIILVFYGTYLGASRVGSKVLVGLQGRYFLPIFPFLLIFLRSIDLRYLVLMTAFLLVFNIFFTLKGRYYNYFYNPRLGKNCNKALDKNKTLTIDKDFKINISRREAKDENQKIILGFCLKIRNLSERPSYTYKLEFFDKNMNLIDRHYLRLTNNLIPEKIFTFINDQVSKSEMNILRITPIYKEDYEAPIEIDPQTIDLVYAF